jgi:hypothetical protein
MYRFSIPTLQAAFDYEHEHRFTEHERGVAEREYFLQTRFKSKPATRIPEEPFFCKP